MNTVCGVIDCGKPGSPLSSTRGYCAEHYFEIENRRTSLYQCYASSGELIYVGITNGGVNRSHDHARSSKWWPLVAAQTWEHYPTRKKAEEREAFLIHLLRPRFNRHIPALNSSWNFSGVAS